MAERTEELVRFDIPPSHSFSIYRKFVQSESPDVAPENSPWVPSSWFLSPIGTPVPLTPGRIKELRAALTKVAKEA